MACSDTLVERDGNKSATLPKNGQSPASPAQGDVGKIAEGKESVTKPHWLLMTQRKVVQNVVKAKIYIL